MATFGPFTQGEVEQAFNSFDLDGNSFIGAAELRQVYSALGDDVTDEEIDEMIAMVDTDGDGQISLQEFAKMVFKYANQAPEPGEVKGLEHIEEGFSDSSSSNSATDASAHEVEVDSNKGIRRVEGVGRRAELQPINHSGPDKKLELKKTIEELNITHFTLEDFNKAFRELDTDGNGQLDYQEFCQVLQVEESPLVQRMFSLFDADGTGSIDCKEFLVGISSFVGASKDDRMKFAFRMFDEDGSGFITKAELTKILRATYMASSDAQVRKKADAIMRQADKDGDGQISHEEFVDVSRRFPNLLFPVHAATRNLHGLFSQ